MAGQVQLKVLWYLHVAFQAKLILSIRVLANGPITSILPTIKPAKHFTTMPLSASSP